METRRKSTNYELCEGFGEKSVTLIPIPKEKTKTPRDFPDALLDHRNSIDIRLRKKIQAMVTEGISSKKKEKRVKGVRSLWVSRSFDKMKEILMEPPIKEGEKRKITLGKSSDEDSEYEDSDEQVDPLESSEQKDQRVHEEKLKLIKDLMRSKFEKMLKGDLTKLNQLSMDWVQRLIRIASSKYLSLERARTQKLVRSTIDTLRHNLKKSRLCIKTLVLNKYHDSKKNAMQYIKDYFDQDLEFRTTTYRKMMEGEKHYQLNYLRNCICTHHERVLWEKEKSWERILERIVERQRKQNDFEIQSLERRLHSAFCDLAKTRNQRLMARMEVEGVKEIPRCILERLQLDFSGPIRLSKLPSQLQMEKASGDEASGSKKCQGDEPPCQVLIGPAPYEVQIIEKEPEPVKTWKENSLYDISIGRLLQASFQEEVPVPECRSVKGLSYTSDLEIHVKEVQDRSSSGFQIVQKDGESVQVERVDPWSSRVQRLIDRYQQLITLTLDGDPSQTEYLLSLEKLIIAKNKMAKINMYRDNMREVKNYLRQRQATYKDILAEMNLEESVIVEALSKASVDNMAVALSVINDILRRVIPEPGDEYGFGEEGEGFDGEWENIFLSGDWRTESMESESCGCYEFEEESSETITEASETYQLVEPSFWVPPAIGAPPPTPPTPPKNPVDERIAEIIGIVRKHPRILDIPF